MPGDYAALVESGRGYDAPMSPSSCAVSDCPKPAETIFETPGDGPICQYAVCELHAVTLEEGIDFLERDGGLLFGATLPPQLLNFTISTGDVWTFHLGRDGMATHDVDFR